jgi:hypothetical protein
MRPDASNNATILEITLKSFLEELNNLDQVWLTVLPGKVLQVEHQSFYEGVEGIDFTDPQYLSALTGLHRYTYDRDGIPAGERFYHADEEASLPPFKRYQFTYDITAFNALYPNCIYQFAPILEHVASRSCQDVMAMVANPHNFDSKGICFIDAIIVNGSRVVPSGRFYNGEPYAHLNNHLTPWYTANELWVHGRYFLAAQSNQLDGSLINLYFESARKYKRQVPIRVKICDIADFDPLAMQKTQMGWGNVTDTVEYSLKTGVLTVNLLHD